MKRYIFNLLEGYFLELLIVLYYCRVNNLLVFNTPFVILQSLVSIMLIGFILVIIWKRKHPQIKKIKNLFSLIFVFALLFPVSSDIYIKNRIFKINSVNDFQKINWNPYGTYIINKNLDFTEYQANRHYMIKNFYGKLDGNNKSISHLNLMLFENNSGTIKNLTITKVNINITDSYMVGSVAAENQGIILNVHVLGVIIGRYYVGGITGITQGVIRSSSFNGELTGYINVGGIAGAGGSTTIEDSFSEGKVTGSFLVGGIIGSLTENSIINNCYSDMDINAINEVGGIAGKAVDNEINHSFVLGNITADDQVGVLAYSYQGDSQSFFLGTMSCPTYTAEANIFYNSGSISHIPDGMTLTINTESEAWFSNVVGLDSTAWDLSLVSKGKIPILQGISNQPLTYFKN